jgi:hypothetical protein
MHSKLNLIYSMAKGKKITRSKARKWVNSYKKKFGKEKYFLSSMLFDKEIVLKLLSEQGCEGLRVYNALDDEGKEHFILVGADAKGNNILPDDKDNSSITSRATGSEAMLVDDGYPCPGNVGCPDNI